MKKTIQLYAVMAGITTPKGDFFPTCNKSTDYRTDLGKALEIYESISAKDFDLKDIDTEEVYMKYIAVVEIPLESYEFWMAYKKNDFGEKTTKEERMGFINDIAIWEEYANYLENIKCETFKIAETKTFYKIVNVKEYAEQQEAA